MVIAVWYCPVVMGKKKTQERAKIPQERAKTHRNGQKTPEYYVVFPMVH